jgi:transposase
VHAVLADRGIPARSNLWTKPGRAWLEALDLPPTPRVIIDDCCGVLDALATPIARLEGEIGALAKPDPRVQALMALPGVGKLTARGAYLSAVPRCEYRSGHDGGDRDVHAGMA